MVCLFLCLDWCWGSAAAAGLAYVGADALDGITGGDTVIVDTRPLAACSERSLAGAHCLPATDLVGPDGELPSPPDLLWALGTAGLSGHESALVVGAHGEARDFVAGLLYLAGQRRVEVLRTPIGKVMASARYRTGPGRARGILQDPIYTATMRDRLVVLRAELRRDLDAGDAPEPVDGRPAAQFRRAGHIPGARNLPLARLAARPGAAAALSARGRYVAYGNDPMASVALFTRLRAGSPAATKVLLGGWRAWHTAPGYPVAGGRVKAAQAPATWWWRAAGAAMVIAALVLLALIFTNRKAQRWT